jgi:beta-glucosidase
MVSEDARIKPSKIYAHGDRIFCCGESDFPMYKLACWLFLLSFCLVVVVGGEPFVFGTASASWQYEGALHARGRGSSIWEDYCGGTTPVGIPNCIGGLGPGEVAVDQYNLTRLEEDISLMQKLGTTAYRLSLSWSRIMPTGRPPVDTSGVFHYKHVLRMLNDAGIDPWVTLFHFDLPSALEKEEGGWLNRSMAGRFEAYAKLCFHEFGPFVKRWLTINEAHTIATAGYLYGNAAPGRCSNRSFCSMGNGTVEPYVVGHNLLRAHAKAVAVFRDMKKGSPPILHPLSTITMVISGDWTEPWNSADPRDAEASQRRQEFQIGWFGDPIFFGNYPKSMREGIGGGRLPEFTAKEQRLLRGSVDYFALNHYTSRYGQTPNSSICSEGGGANISGGEGWDQDQCCSALTTDRWGRPIGPRPEGSEWLFSVPWGLRSLLRWVAHRYNNSPIVVTENGCVDPVQAAQAPKEVNDTFRIAYHQGYLAALRRAMIEDKVDIRGYFVWSLLDNVEWGDGFRDRFGLYSVDRPSLDRIPKASVRWISDYIRKWKNQTKNKK